MPKSGSRTLIKIFLFPRLRFDLILFQTLMIVQELPVEMAALVKMEQTLSSANVILAGLENVVKLVSKGSGST